MANLLPYAIIGGVALVFFVVCYILFSGNSEGRGKKEKKQESQRAQAVSAAYHKTEAHGTARRRQAKEDTAPVPRLSTVTIREREEHPDETAFVTTKGEVVRQNGKIVYEEPQRQAKKHGAENLDVTRVLSREEILEAMEKVDKEAAAANKAKEEEAKKAREEETEKARIPETPARISPEKTEAEKKPEEAAEPTLADMAAIVAADLAEKQGDGKNPAPARGRSIVKDVMEETAKAARQSEQAKAPDTSVSDETQPVRPALEPEGSDEGVSDETQIISPVELREKLAEARKETAADSTQIMRPVEGTRTPQAGRREEADSAGPAKSPWGNDMVPRPSAKAAQSARPSIWSTAADADSPVIKQCTAHFLSQFGMVTAEMKQKVETITVAAFQNIGCQNDSDRKKALGSLLVQEALQNAQKAYVAHPDDYVASLVLQAFADIVKGSPVSTRHLVAVDALKVMPYLSESHYKILAVLLLFLYSRNSHNVDKETFAQYIEKYVLPFLDGFPTERSYYQQLDYLHCTAIEGKETHFAEILADSYPLLFRYRGITEEELRKALKGTPMPAEYVVPSFNSPLVKLAMIDENMATRFFRLTGISDRAIQAHLLRLAKKRPANFSGEEALDIMEDISPVLADLSDIWDSSMLRVSTLSLLGLYLAQGYVKERIGEEFDLSRWFE